MNRQDIIAWAHEAQFEGFGNGDWVCTTEEIERFAALVVAAKQREWVGLIWGDLPSGNTVNYDFLVGAVWAEEKLREKNT